jgi:hypothetical protein
MLAGFPSNRQAGDEARAVLAAYLLMIGDFPPWAVAEACRQWVVRAKEKGQTLAFPPSAAELREVCGDIVRRYQTERARLTLALAAKARATDPAEHAHVAAGFDAVTAEMRAGRPDRKREVTPGEARAALERQCAELGIDPAEIDKVRDQPLSFRKLHAPVDTGLPSDVEPSGDVTRTG